MKEPKVLNSIFTGMILLSCTTLIGAESGQNVPSVAEQNVSGSWGGRNPAAIRSNGPTLEADFFYWNANEDGLEYASEVTVDSALTQYKGSDLDIRGKWKPGFRVGLGWLFGNFDQWDLSLDWTWYYTKASRSAESNDITSRQLIPHWMGTLGPLATSAKSTWNLHLNTLDLSLGRDYYISKRITAKPFMGLRAAWIDQDVKASYNGAWSFATLAGLSVLQQNTHFKADSDFKGLGLRAGADFVWHFCDQWGLVGKAAGSILYGKYDLKESIKGFGPDQFAAVPTLKVNNISIDDDYHRIRANIEAAGGIQWERGFSNDKYHLTLGLSWEMSYWFSQNQFFQVTTAHDSRPVLGGTGTVSSDNSLTQVRQNGDLSFQGVTFNANVNF